MSFRFSALRALYFPLFLLSVFAAGAALGGDKIVAAFAANVESAVAAATAATSITVLRGRLLVPRVLISSINT